MCVKFDFETYFNKKFKKNLKKNYNLLQHIDDDDIDYRDLNSINLNAISSRSSNFKTELKSIYQKECTNLEKIFLNKDVQI